MKQLHIISTEDDSLIRRILAELVTPEGHEIQFARNSEDLFALLVKRTWDLVILDVNVPGMNGYQIAREICARYGDKRPKILIFTGRNTKSEQGLATISGADAILEKGCPLPLLVETINRLGGNLPATPGATPTSPSPASAPTAPAAPPTPTPVPVNAAPRQDEPWKQRLAEIEKNLKELEREADSLGARMDHLCSVAKS